MQEYSYFSEVNEWEAFREGDRIAFERLLKFHYPTLLDYGIRLTRDQDFAQDGLQDFFINLWKNRKNLDTPKSVKAYLISSYRRHLFREKSRNSWYRNTTKLESEHDIEVQFNIETYLINNEIEHETLLKLQRYLYTLTKRQREALYLRFDQELEYEEISSIMNINQHSVVNLVYGALRILRKNWVMAFLITLI